MLIGEEPSVKDGEKLSFMSRPFAAGTLGKQSEPVLRGCSSVGRALAWHARGQGFNSPQLHYFHL